MFHLRTSIGLAKGSMRNGAHLPCLSAIPAGVLVSLVLANVGLAQPVRVLKQPAVCAVCSLSVSRVGEVKDDGDKLTIGSLYALVMLDRDRAAIWGAGMDGFRVWNLQSNQIVKVGRSGSGPGEYQSINNVLPHPSRGLYVLDGAARRVTVLSPNYAVMSTFSLQDVRGPTTVVLSPTGRIVTAGALATTPSFGLPFHLYGVDGKFAKSFGPTTPNHQAKDNVLLARRLVGATGNSFWSVGAIDFRLEEWSYDMKLLGTIVGNYPTLRRNAAPAWPYGAEAPPDEILALSMYARDTAMVVTRVSKMPWPKITPTVVSTDEGRASKYEIDRSDRDRFFGTRVELIDLKKSEVIVMEQLPFAVFGAGPRALVHSRYGKDDLVTIEVFRVDLKRQRSTINSRRLPQ